MAAAKTERINIWLTPDQIAWLKAKKNASEHVRALITEAMNMENLAKSVKKAKPTKKK
jgi:hypothetical protein